MHRAGGRFSDSLKKIQVGMDRIGDQGENENYEMGAIILWYIFHRV